MNSKLRLEKYHRITCKKKDFPILPHLVLLASFCLLAILLIESSRILNSSQVAVREGFHKRNENCFVVQNTEKTPLENKNCCVSSLYLVSSLLLQSENLKLKRRKKNCLGEEEIELLSAVNGKMQAMSDFY